MKPQTLMLKAQQNLKPQCPKIWDFVHWDLIGHWSLVIGVLKNYFPTSYKLQTTSFQRGFSLVEVLVGSAVLIIAVTGTLSIISRNVSSAAIAEERVTAFYLAQEALEFVRSVRDNNAIAPDH